MSFQNQLDQKRLRLYERLGRKQAAQKVIPFNGVIVRKVDVHRHQYLRDRGLSHSERLASVFTGHE